MKMFLTVWEKAQIMVTGDPGQVDLPRRTISGLKEALLILKDIEGIGIIYLDDIVRHRLVKKKLMLNTVRQHKQFIVSKFVF
jgi:phosphate starvation-inducible PhoH-like protein